jgi:hypothetical protein
VRDAIPSKILLRMAEESGSIPFATDLDRCPSLSQEEAIDGRPRRNIYGSPKVRNDNDHAKQKIVPHKQTKNRYCSNSNPDLATMARRRRESLSALPDELLEEILLRLPPDEPAWLLRASLVCKSWSHAISSPGFHCRLHELHRAPPVLGFLHHRHPQCKDTPQFVPTTASAFSLDAPKCRLWRAINCRHGRALFCSDSYDDPELLVWEPITGSEWRVSLKPVISRRAAISGAVFCAADGCDHRDCHGSPFEGCSGAPP